jgi:hypothetical protein
LLAEKKIAHETFLLSVLQNGGKCWSEFYKYVKRRKGNRETLSAIKDHNGTIVTDSTEKANILNSNYVSFFCCDHNIPKMQLANSGETFLISTKIIRKWLVKIGRNKSVRPDGVPGEILTLDREAMTPLLARLL